MVLGGVIEWNCLIAVGAPAAVAGVKPPLTERQKRLGQLSEVGGNHGQGHAYAPTMGESNGNVVAANGEPNPLGTGVNPAPIGNASIVIKNDIECAKGVLVPLIEESSEGILRSQVFQPLPTSVQLQNGR